MVKQFYKKLKIVKVGDILVGSYEIEGRNHGFTSLQITEILDVPLDGVTM